MRAMKGWRSTWSPYKSQIRLKKHMVSLEKDLKSLEGAMLHGFADMSKFVGITFEEFVRVF